MRFVFIKYLMLLCTQSFIIIFITPDIIDNQFRNNSHRTEIIKNDMSKVSIDTTCAKKAIYDLSHISFER